MTIEEQKYQPINSEQDDLEAYDKHEIDAKFKDVNIVLIGVILVLLIMVATLIIDSFHINSATYKEYSEKTDLINFLKESNEELLKENKNNQGLIIEQQNQILNLLDKIK